MRGPPGTAAPSIRVAILASYPSVRAGLRALLALIPAIDVVQEGSEPDDLTEADNASVILIDLEGEGAGETVSRVLQGAPTSGLVLLGPSAGAARLVALLGERAWSYLLRDAGLEELSEAILAVAQGFVLLQPPLARQLLTPRGFTDISPDISPDISEEAGLTEPLTNREQEVLQLVAQGLANKTIALRLGISEHTVKFHITSILSKLDAASRTEAVRLGARRGLIVL